jgi:L-lactate dehydrogenase complex protein LldG
MSSREEILGRIRAGLAGQASPPLPPVHEVWPRRRPAIDEMADRFARELAEVHGETIRCPTMDDARHKLAELSQQGQWKQIGALDRPLCRELAKGLPQDALAWPRPDWTPTGMAELSAGLLEADCLLADTGSAMIACGTAQDRVLCYLPPACVIVATVDRLVEHLPQAWEAIGPRAADPALRGEFVLITGPSRTADIEKILILGVHGPKRLVVLLVG